METEAGSGKAVVDEKASVQSSKFSSSQRRDSSTPSSGRSAKDSSGSKNVSSMAMLSSISMAVRAKVVASSFLVVKGDGLEVGAVVVVVSIFGTLSWIWKILVVKR